MASGERTRYHRARSRKEVTDGEHYPPDRTVIARAPSSRRPTSAPDATADREERRSTLRVWVATGRGTRRSRLGSVRRPAAGRHGVSSGSDPRAPAGHPLSRPALRRQDTLRQQTLPPTAPSTTPTPAGRPDQPPAASQPPVRGVRRGAVSARDRNADCAVGSGEWAEPPHSPGLLRHRGEKSAIFAPFFHPEDPPRTSPQDSRGAAGTLAPRASSSRIGELRCREAVAVIRRDPGYPRVEGEFRRGTTRHGGDLAEHQELRRRPGVTRRPPGLWDRPITPPARDSLRARGALVNRPRSASRCRTGGLTERQPGQGDGRRRSTDCVARARGARETDRLSPDRPRSGRETRPPGAALARFRRRGRGRRRGVRGNPGTPPARGGD